MTKTLVASLLPARDVSGNKGTFGRALVIAGSLRYPGAGHLATEAALRGGAGYVTFAADADLCREVRMKFPEALFLSGALTPADLAAASEKANATLFGPGAGNTEQTVKIAAVLLGTKGGTLILDADALNALSSLSDRGEGLLRAARRPVILTPHPLEFSRLTGIPVETVSADREAVAKEYAARCGVTLVLKGAGTVVTDGKKVFVNTTGSDALAKAGSGDVLAGLLVSLAVTAPPFDAALCAVYLHGAAGDTLEQEFSSRGVTPSDLPRAIAREMTKLA